MTNTTNTPGIALDKLRALIADDGYAISFQSMGQYRTALLTGLDEALRSERAEDGVVEANRKLLLDRSRVGLKKYGVALADSGLSRTQLAQHALEEALDLANYLQTILQTDCDARQAAPEAPTDAMDWPHAPGRPELDCAPEATTVTREEIYTLRRLIECAEKLDERSRPMCRDCADENGTCPNSGLECDMRKLFADAKLLHNRLASAGGAGAPATQQAGAAVELCQRCTDFGECNPLGARGCEATTASASGGDCPACELPADAHQNCGSPNCAVRCDGPGDACKSRRAPAPSLDAAPAIKTWRVRHSESIGVQPPMHYADAEISDLRAALARAPLPADTPKAVNVFTCKGKGGEYELVGYSNGAGPKRGESIVVYRDTKQPDVFYHRSAADFRDRMEWLGGRAPLPAQGHGEE